MSVFSPVERMLAWRYLRARRREGFISLTTWFAIIGIMLGVATLILVTSLMNGIREEMTSRFIGIGGHIVVMSNTGPFIDYRQAADVAGSVAGVTSVVAKVEGQVMATSEGIALGAQVIALPAKALEQRALFNEHVDAGSLDGLKNGEGIVLGYRLARNLHLSVGDEVTLISPQGRSSIAGFIPRMKSYPVMATLKLGMHEFDASLILMPFADAQTYFMLNTPEGDAISNLEISVRNPDEAPRIARQIHEKIGPNVEVIDWQKTHAGVFSALKVQRNVMIIILALIILVAVFNIISSLVMLVKDKGHDIAILRTMGATKASVMRIFILAGTLIGVTGTFGGVLLGLWLAKNIEALHQFVEKLTGQEILIENIYFLSTLPTKTDPDEVAVIIGLSLALSFLATIYPARRAARLDPAEALRYE